MKALNEVTLSGNLGGAPDIAEGAKSGTLTLATNRSYTDASGERKEDTQWHRVSLRGKVLEAVQAANLSKGDRVLVIGEARSYKYEDDQQVTRFMHEVAAHTVARVLLPPKTAQQ